jgi:hypothetical protein
MNPGADVRNFFLEELTVGRRPLYISSMIVTSRTGVTSRSVVGYLETDTSADGLGPVVLFGGFQIHGR